MSGAPSPNLQELVAVSQVIMGNMNVAALLIIVPTVVAPSSNSRSLLGIGSHKVHVWIGVDLRELHGAELRPVQSQSLVGGERAAHLAAAVPPIRSFLRTRRFTGTLTGVRAATNERQEVRDGHSPSLRGFQVLQKLWPLTCQR